MGTIANRWRIFVEITEGVHGYVKNTSFFRVSATATAAHRYIAAVKQSRKEKAKAAIVISLANESSALNVLIDNVVYLLDRRRHSVNMKAVYLMFDSLSNNTNY